MGLKALEELLGAYSNILTHPYLSSAFVLVEAEADLCSKPLCTTHTSSRESWRSIYANHLCFLSLSPLVPWLKGGGGSLGVTSPSRC